MAIFLRWETERKTDWSNNGPFEGIAFPPPSRIKILLFSFPFAQMPFTQVRRSLESTGKEKTLSRLSEN